MQLTTISGKSPLAGAIRYALARMERLRPYLNNGILELVLSRICAAPSTRLGHLAFESQGAFPSQF